jgi:iron complex outermembrane receptor protein
VAAFFNDYDDVRSLETIPSGFVFANKLYGESYGLELAADWHPLNWWHLQGSYSYLKTTMHIKGNGTDETYEYVNEESSPDHQLSLRSSMDLRDGWEFDLWAYYVGHLPASGTAAYRNDIKIDSYVGLNARLAWKIVPGLELSVVGQNLLDSRHLEFVEETVTYPTEVERSFYGQIRWIF